MKILVTGLSDPYFAPMLRGFLNYYLPEEYLLYSGKDDPMPADVAIELMEDVGIDISNRISKPTAPESWSDFDLVITTTINTRNHLSGFDTLKNMDVRNLEYQIDETLSGKAFKKHLKKARKQLQRYGEQILEESV